MFFDRFGVIAYKIVVGLIEILRAAAFVNDKPDRLLVSIFAGDGYGLVFFFYWEDGLTLFVVLGRGVVILYDFGVQVEPLGDGLEGFLVLKLLTVKVSVRTCQVVILEFA